VKNRYDVYSNPPAGYACGGIFPHFLNIIYATINTDMSKKNTPLASWSVEEYSHRDKNSDWFWALGIITITTATVAVIYHNILFSVVIVLSAIILGYFASRKPDVIEVILSEEGIQMKDMFYPYEKIQGFAIDRHILSSYLLIETDRILMPVIAVPLPEGDLDYEMLEEFMKERVPSKPLRESVGHRLMEYLGF
jgi:hypothetical protein